MYTLGYSFKPWSEAEAIADGPSILDYIARDRARARHRSRTSASATAWCAPSGRPPTRAGRSRPQRTDTGETVALDLRLPLPVQRLLPLRRGLHAGVRGRRALRRRDRPPAALARGPRLHGQAGRRDRQRRDRRDPRARDGRARRARDDAAALAELRPLAARARTRSPTLLRRWLPARLAYPIVRWKNVAARHCLLPRSAGARPASDQAG